ncbi:hypothetical protein FB451DRAFT_1290408 [Mycena latifolia]|nr:hypothetical protein FB451DRAFT_1290408 [Mycena latifolia]
MGIFQLGSLLCGIAPQSSVLIFGRAIGGLGSTGVFTGVLITVGAAHPSHQRLIQNRRLLGHLDKQFVFCLGT